MSKNRPRRILILCPSTTIGGAERVAQNLARQLTAAGDTVKLVLPVEPGSAALGWFQAQGVAAEESPALRDFMQPRGPRDVWALRCLIRNSGAEVVNLQYPVNWVSVKDVLAVRLAGGARCIATVHSPTPVDSETDPQQVKNTRRAASLCHAVTVVSDWSRQQMQKMGVPPNKLRVVHNGVPPPAHLPTPSEARASLGLPEQAFVISTMAHLVARKGVADLIQAVSLMPDPAGDIRLVIGGDGEERSSLEALARERLGNRAIFLGRILGDTSQVYAAGDVFALPSYLDNFPLVFLEAAFHGVPCVGTDVGGTPEAILDQRTGLLVPVSNPHALAAALQRLREQPELRASLGETARARACAEFTDQAMAQAYTEVFRR